TLRVVRVNSSTPSASSSLSTRRDSADCDRNRASEAARKLPRPATARNARRSARSKFMCQTQEFIGSLHFTAERVPQIMAHRKIARHGDIHEAKADRAFIPIEDRHAPIFPRPPGNEPAPPAARTGCAVHTRGRRRLPAGARAKLDPAKLDPVQA